MSKTAGNNGLVGCDGGGGLTRVQEVRFVSYLKNVNVCNRSQLFLERKNIPLNGIPLNVCICVGQIQERNSICQFKMQVYLSIFCHRMKMAVFKHVASADICVLAVLHLILLLIICHLVDVFAYSSPNVI